MTTMKKWLFPLAAGTLALGLAACNDETPKEEQPADETEQVETKDGEEMTLLHTKGIIDDVSDERILVTIEESPIFEGKSEGQQVFFSTGELDETLRDSLKRGQHVDVAHTEQMGMSHPPFMNAVELDVTDPGNSEVPHVAIFKYDDEQTRNVRMNEVTGSSVAELETALEAVTWTDEDITFEQPATYTFAVENGATDQSGTNFLLWEEDGDAITLYNADTEQSAHLVEDEAKKIKNIVALNN